MLRHPQGDGKGCVGATRGERGQDHLLHGAEELEGIALGDELEHEAIGAEKLKQQDPKHHQGVFAEHQQQIDPKRGRGHKHESENANRRQAHGVLDELERDGKDALQNILYRLGFIGFDGAEGDAEEERKDHDREHAAELGLRCFFDRVLGDKPEERLAERLPFLGTLQVLGDVLVAAVLGHEIGAHLVGESASGADAVDGRQGQRHGHPAEQDRVGQRLSADFADLFGCSEFGHAEHEGRKQQRQHDHEDEANEELPRWLRDFLAKPLQPWVLGTEGCLGDPPRDSPEDHGEENDEKMRRLLHAARRLLRNDFFCFDWLWCGGAALALPASGTKVGAHGVLEHGLQLDAAGKFAPADGIPIRSVQRPLPQHVGRAILEFHSGLNRVAEGRLEVFALGKEGFACFKVHGEANLDFHRLFFSGRSLGLFRFADRRLDQRDFLGEGFGEFAHIGGIDEALLFVVGDSVLAALDKSNRDLGRIGMGKVRKLLFHLVQGVFGFREITNDQGKMSSRDAQGYPRGVPWGVMKIWIALTMTVVLGLAGCNSSSSTTTTTPTSGEKPAEGAPSGKKLKVGMVFDTGGLGDKSFNDSANAGLERAKKELGIEAITVTSTSPSEYASNLGQLAAQGCDLVVAVGLGMNEAAGEIAPQHPNVKFAVVDGSAKGDNVRGLLFREEQGSFLAGYLAGLMTKSNKIGFVGGMEIPLIKKFEFGYRAGAMYANPNAVVLPAKYTMNWDSQDKGKSSAVALYSEGADIVFHAAGRAGLGVFKAAEEANKFAIGVDSDQDDQAKGLVLTSMIKRVDEAVFQTIKDIQDGKFTSGDKTYDLAVNGVGLSPMTYTKEKIGAANLEKIEKVRQELISGTITAPASEEEYKAFVAARKTN